MAQHPDIMSDEIDVDLMEENIKSLPELEAIYSTNHTILIHGMGGTTRGFYKRLKYNKDVELLWTGWCCDVWWTYLLSFIPGQAGVVKVIDRHKLDTLYLDIGGLSKCGLYFIPNEKVESIVEIIRKERAPDLYDYFIDEKDYFILIVDFDYPGGERDGEIYYRELYFGENLDSKIKEVLTRAK